MSFEIDAQTIQDLGIFDENVSRETVIIEAFAQIRKSSFCISTHITEVADNIPNKDNILFKFFDVNIMGSTPVYTYKLQDGVSHERLGMLIVKNEKILELLAASRDRRPE